jgi:predicted membrane channel-forming protein YqfA (hemolysin III family)
MASLQADPWKIVSFSLYGATLVLLYGVSTPVPQRAWAGQSLAAEM